KQIIERPPTIIDVKTIGARNPSSYPPAALKPYTIPPKPIVENSIEIKSIFGFVTSETFTKYLRSEEHTSELQSRFDLVCRLLLEKKKKNIINYYTYITDY